MKKLLFVLFLAVILVFAGCSPDDEELDDIEAAEDAGENGENENEEENAGEPETNAESEADAESEEDGETETEEPTEPPPPPLSPFIITSPYAGVDWSGFGQYKAALHVHSTNSDGDDTLADIIEEYYRQDYDILAITDHDYLTADWVSARNGLTQKRFDEISAGSDRNGRGMLQIPYTNEQSGGEHLNTFFTDFNNPGSGASLEKNINITRGLDGICRINHPGCYTGGKVIGKAGVNASQDPENISKYTDLFSKYSCCVGMEIITNKDAESFNDRILWDNILTQTVPQGRYVWGFSDDDAHNTADAGYCFNIFVMPENSLDNFKEAMYSGSFYAVSRISRSRRELGNASVSTAPVPVILEITVDNENSAVITITAAYCDKIEWISNGRIIAKGDTIDIEKYKKKIGCYVRANIIGPGGIAFTQPFGVSLR